MKKYSFSNAEQDDLWDELTKQAYEDGTLDSSLSVKTIMDTWTLQMGYPVVQVNRDFNTNKLSISQKWFLVNPLNKIQNTNEYNTYKWYIPFTHTTKIESNFDFDKKPEWIMLDNDINNQLEIDLGVANNVQGNWIIGNLKHSGFYRVNYDTENWNLLINQLFDDHEMIEPTARAQLIDDSFNLGRAEYIDQITFLNITVYLNKEIDPLPFTTMFNGMNYIGDMLSTDYIAFNLFKVIEIFLLLIPL